MLIAVPPSSAGKPGPIGPGFPVSGAVGPYAVTVAFAAPALVASSISMSRPVTTS
jgi:hypothetical protein